MSAPKEDDLPNFFVGAPDVEAICAWMKRMIAQLRVTELVILVVSLIVKMRELNADLLRQVAHLRRVKPANEKLAPLLGQLALAFPGAVQREPKDKGDKGDKKPRRKHMGRNPFPEHLPRVDEPNPVPAALRVCPVCGADMKTVGHEVCERLAIIPAQLVVIRSVSETVACPNDDTIVSAPARDGIVPRGKLDTSLIIEATLDKYVEHQPIERQCTRWARASVEIASQTLGRGVACAIDALLPIAELIHENTRRSPLLAADSTGLRVLDADHARGVRSGTMWCWVGSGRWVSFVYSAVGDAKGFSAFLGEDEKALARVVQCDGTSITNCIEKAGGKRPGCWAHARRKFVAAARSGDLDALEPLRIMRKLFAVDRLSAMKGDTADERKARRLEHCVAILAELDAWRKDKAGTTPPKTPLGVALGYLGRQWARLGLFLENGLVELTNNRVERELRRLVLGRKNWLFVNGDLNGERTAAILTILGTCIAQRINPRAYLHLLAKRIVEKWPRAQYAELLPMALAAQHPELRVAPSTQRLRSEYE